MKRYLNKPMTVTLVSICEALIFDFIDRSKFFTQEGVTGLNEVNLEKLRTAKSWSMDQKIRLLNCNQ